MYFISGGKFNVNVQNVNVLNGVSRSEKYILSVIPAFVFLNKQKQSFSPEENNLEKLKLFDG